MRVVDWFLRLVEQGRAALLPCLLRDWRALCWRLQPLAGLWHVHLSERGTVPRNSCSDGVADNCTVVKRADSSAIAGAVSCADECTHWRTECIADASSNSGAYSGAKRGSVICTESSFDTGS